jgi:putative membrane protein
MKSKLVKSTIALLFATSFAMHTSTATASELDDGAIIAIYNQVNTFDIETAGLGLSCGQSSQVKALAKMVQSDHTGVRQMAADLATKIDTPKSLPAGREQAAEAHARVLGELQSKCNDGFDQAYLKHEIAFHTAAIDAVKTVLIPSAKNPELVALMQKILPGFEHHLAESRRVAKELGY